jgi:hypothetical protein
MRFAHKKIPKILVFLHISSGEPGDALVSELPDCRVVRRLKLSGDYNKPANGITCMFGAPERPHDPAHPAAMRKG